MICVSDRLFLLGTRRLFIRGPVLNSRATYDQPTLPNVDQ